MCFWWICVCVLIWIGFGEYRDEVYMFYFSTSCVCVCVPSFDTVLKTSFHHCAEKSKRINSWLNRSHHHNDIADQKQKQNTASHTPTYESVNKTKKNPWFDKACNEMNKLNVRECIVCAVGALNERYG